MTPEHIDDILARARGQCYHDGVAEANKVRHALVEIVKHLRQLHREHCDRPYCDDLEGVTWRMNDGKPETIVYDPPPSV